MRLALITACLLLPSVFAPALAQDLLPRLLAAAPHIDPKVLALALEARDCAMSGAAVDRPQRLAVIDYTLPSTDKRLWIFDLRKATLLYEEHVAHGRGSGGNMATRFSNIEGSYQSSIGLFVAAETYQCENGYSRRLDGLAARKWQLSDQLTGRFYEVPPSRFAPKPVQRPNPPLLLGGNVPAAWRRAGRLGDGWLGGSMADLTRLDATIGTVKQAASEAGRDPDSLRFVCRGVVRVHPPGGHDRKPLVGSLDEIRGDLDGLRAQGLTEVFFDLNFDPEIGSPDADPDVSVRRAEEVLEALAPS